MRKTIRLTPSPDDRPPSEAEHRQLVEELNHRISIAGGMRLRLLTMLDLTIEMLVVVGAKKDVIERLRKLEPATKSKRRP